MKTVLIPVLLALVAGTAPAQADPAGDELADSVCVALNFPALPPGYAAPNDRDISVPGVAGDGLVYEEHGRHWLRWTKLDIAPAATTAATFHALCRVYRQPGMPGDDTVPSATFLVKVEKVTGPGEHWFTFRRDP